MNYQENDNEYKRLLAEKQERLKELACINHTTQIVREGKSVEETLRRVTFILPKAWQFPEETVARITYGDLVFTTPRFRETEWLQSQSFTTLSDVHGKIDIYYLEKFPDSAEGPFLKEERDLINNLSSIISSYLDTIEARKLLKKNDDRQKKINYFDEPGKEGKELYSRQLLQKFLNRQNANRDIFHDLMPYKVKEVMLVATLYDAFAMEKEGRFSEHILGEYYQLTLTSMPRVTGVSTIDEAAEQLRLKPFDIVILMIGNDRDIPKAIAQMVKKEFPYVPVYGLLNNNIEIEEIKKDEENLKYIDNLFAWNGDSKIFFAMIKLLEDRVNVDNDTQIGLVKVILLVEDSEIYYSRYLPILYNAVLEQTKRIIEDVSSDELFKVLQFKARPKVILAKTYEEAYNVVERFGNNLLCIITDVKFRHNGVMDDSAGFKFISQVKEQYNELPSVIQSSDTLNANKAFELKSVFIDKNSQTLVQEIKSFISHYLGFGNFVYRDPGGRKIAEARSLKEFEDQIETIPIESLVYHGKRNHFSLWLMARGEIKIAKMINPVKVTDFKTPQEFRNYLKYVIKKYRNETNTGRIVSFEESSLLDETNIVSLGTGALGGKGRGIAFINNLIYNLNFSDLITGINVRTPRTSIVGTDEFDFFLDKNNFNSYIHGGVSYREVRNSFLSGEISYNLEKKLRSLLTVMRMPLAVRSSSLLEDSTTQPFSGVFDTYLIPNNNDDPKIRYRQLTDAIKLVYASIYSDESRSYFEAINYKVEEEKMAVIIQELVGEQHENVFYPYISGTAQSHNYYPVSHMKPEDGVAIAALGLGHYVVQGEKAYRFSPKYPDHEINTPKSLLRNSQVEFIALDLSNQNFDFLNEGPRANLARLPISDSERHGTLNHLASVYNPDNDRIESGLTSHGPRILNFHDILKYNHIPLSKTIDLILDVGKEALGIPVEIEYAVDLRYNNSSFPSFYLLQIKPLPTIRLIADIDVSAIEREKTFILARRSMGNGIIDHIEDVVFVKPEKFDKLRTKEIASEIDQANNRLKAEGRKYILIGPGRWGSQDVHIGIPVVWAQISNAKVIIETDMEEFPLEGSLGSHFFHNVTTMNIGYFSIHSGQGDEFIDWDTLGKQQTFFETNFVKCSRFESKLRIVMDGRKRISSIFQPDL